MRQRDVLRKFMACSAWPSVTKYINSLSGKDSRKLIKRNKLLRNKSKKSVRRLRQRMLFKHVHIRQFLTSK